MSGGAGQLDQERDNAGQGCSFLAGWAELTHVVHGMQSLHLDVSGVAALKVNRQNLDGASILLDRADNGSVLGGSLSQAAFAACMQDWPLHKSARTAKWCSTASNHNNIATLA